MAGRAADSGLGGGASRLEAATPFWTLSLQQAACRRCCASLDRCFFSLSLSSLFLFRVLTRCVRVLWVCCSVSFSLTLDFDTNKKIAEEVAIIPSKRLRNQIAGFVTHLMKRIQRGGSVRGISLKLQEEERERRLDFIPERSILDVDTVEVDADTADLLSSIDFGELSGVQVQQHQNAAGYVKRPAGKSFGDRKQGDRKQGDRKPRPQKPEATATAAAPATAQ